MKKILAVLCATMLAGQALAATTFNLGTNVQGVVEGETLTISGTGKMRDFDYSTKPSFGNITEVIIEDGVTSIGSCVFYNCSGLTDVTIGNSVTSIGDDAFYNCSGLTSVTIPNSVTSIGSYAFSDCSKLTGINVEPNNTNYESGNGVLFNKGKTELICYPAGKTETTYTIPNSVTSIGDAAFYDCSGLTSVTIPNSVTSIGYATFAGCSGLTSVTIPNSVTSIGDAAFWDCSGLTSVTIPNSVTSIGYATFIGCSGLTSVTIPNSVTSIGIDAFFDCSGLTSVTIPNSVTSIGNYAFYNCSGLTSVTIPNSVTSIGEFAFAACFGLTSVTIPNSVTSIGNYAFYDCSGLTSVTIPNSVTSIGNYAFYNCSGLTSVTIPNSVTSIGDNAFKGIRYIVYSGTAEGCPWGAYGLADNDFVYSDCEKTSIKSYIGNGGDVVIPNSVTSIGEGAFYGCSGLTSVTIPNSVTSIGDAAFRGCIGLTKVTINSNTIASKTYSSSSSLNNIFGTQVAEYVLGGSVTSIGDYAFFDCSGLTSVTIPNSITSIGESVFSNCSSLTEVIIPNSVTHIDKHAFASCTSLTSITIPNSVTNISEYAFDGCGNVISVTIGESVSNIGQCAFNGCNSIKNITCKGLIPPKVENELLTDNIISNAKLYMNATLTRPENAKLYRTLQPWCNFDAPDSNTVHTGETIYVISNNSVRYNIKMTSADTKMGIAIGTGKYDKDETAEIVAIAYYGYHFTKWSDGNTENPRFVNVISDSTFTAEFEVNNYSVLAAANEKEMGKVEGAATYAYLSRTQLKATPNAGYQFEKWSDGETANPRDILVYSDTTFTAIFEIAGCEPVVTSVSESAVSATNIYAYGNTIVVENATDEIRVYNAMGVLVCRDAARHVSTGITSIPVNAPGVYIVKTGSTVKRVMIN